MGPGETAPTADLPYLTAGLPGTGGAIKRSEEDFIVEELPLYEPSGAGTHTYFCVEKCGLTTFAAVERIAAALGKRARDIGYAGLKDARAVTRQVLSVEHVEQERVAALQLPQIRVLWVDRHRNKLKLGHLRGNRFELNIRGVCPAAPDRAAEILAVLQGRGVPNFFGPQRFGARGDNADIGLAVLRGRLDEALHILLGRPGAYDESEVLEARELFEQGRYEAASQAWPNGFREQIRLCLAMARTNGSAGKAWSKVSHHLRRLYLSAAQSLLFNRVLAARIEGIDRLEDGDLAWKHSNGACFRVDDAGKEQPRCERFEISPTGPLFGARMTEPAGVPGQREAQVLADVGLEDERFRGRDRIKLDGARRPLRVPLGEPVMDAGQDETGLYLKLSFALPPGGYATAVVREVCKPSPPSCPGLLQ